VQEAVGVAAERGGRVGVEVFPGELPAMGREVHVAFGA
jgi:hypothetical protein